MNKRPLESVSDTNRHEYRLERELGKGGQGAVYAVKGMDMAVKLLPSSSRELRERIRQNIARVRRLPLSDLHLARPVQMLAEPHVGYVMELMTGMQPISAISEVPREHLSDLSRWYLSTGGLRRRLRACAKLAVLLSELHGRGCSYGDLSPSNVYISESTEDSEVWLIDCDNIYQGVSPRAVYTPGFAAPELLRAKYGTDSFTDAWSLAVLIFQTLAATHPLLGDYVEEGEPELEEKALRGELPWIDHPDDDTNRSSNGVPRDLVMSTSLRDLAHRCFALSAQDRLKRPGASAWAEKLHEAADQTVLCPACNSTYFFNRTRCPWCDAPRPTFALANVYMRDMNRANAPIGVDLEPIDQKPAGIVLTTAKKPLVLGRIAIQPGVWTDLTTRHVLGEGDRPLAGLTLDKPGVVIKGNGTPVVGLEHRKDGKSIPVSDKPSVAEFTARRSWWMLRPEGAKGNHRIVCFELFPGEER